MDEIIEKSPKTANDDEHISPIPVKPKPVSLVRLRIEMKGFSETHIMYVYHALNGRKEEADSYLEELIEEARAEQEYMNKNL
jgi:hypothetical protein